MSDPSENEVIQQSEEEYVPEIDPTNYFKEQDEKFEELHKKLHKLKEENKRQIDAIINSLDDLMASKCVIEQSLDKVTADDIPIEISEKLNIVDLLSKVTGIVNESNDNLCTENQSKECETKDASNSEVCEKEDKSEAPCKMNCTDVKPKSEDGYDKNKAHDNDDSPKEYESAETSTDSQSVSSEN